MALSRNTDTTQEDFERALQNSDFSRAYKVLSELQEYVKEGRIAADLTALRRRLDREAQAARETIITELEVLKNTPVENLNLNTFEQALEILLNTTPEGEQADYNAYKSIYDDRKVNQSRLQDYNRTRALVEDQWAQANRLSTNERTISVSALVPYYTRAMEIATEAATRSPENTLLEVLFQQARAKREALNSEEEIMTSGGLLGDFKRVLRYIEERDADEAVMVYDLIGTPIGRMSKEKARAEVTKNAKAYVLQKSGEYRDSAKAKLDSFDPRGAEAELKKYDKFIELEQIVPDLFRSDDRRRYTELLQQTSEALEKLHRAETTAEQAKKSTVDNLLTAWDIYIEALRIYKGVFNSTVITNTLEYMVEEIMRTVQQESKVIATKLEEFDFDTARTRADDLLRRYQRVTRPVEGLHEEMTRLLNTALIPLKAELEQIENQRETATTGATKRREISQMLHDIGETKDKPAEATKLLNNLLRQYDNRLIAYDPSYLEVSSRVKAAQNATEELSRLKTYLDDNNSDQVRAAQKAAQDVAQSVAKNHQKNFLELAAQLGRHIEELEAASAVFTSGYDEAIKRYQALSRQSDLGSLKKRIEGELARLRTERDVAYENDLRLQELESWIDAEDAEDAIQHIWVGLDKIERFINSDQRDKWLNLLRRSFDRLKIDARFDLVKLNALLARTDEIDTAFADRWRRRLDIFKRVQGARDQEQRGQREAALKTWGQIESLVGADEHTYVIGRIRELTKAQERIKKDNLLNKRPDKSNVAIWLADLTEAAKKYRDEANNAIDALDRVEYLAWALELDLYNAQHRPEISTQSEMLKAASTFAMRELVAAMGNVRTYNLGEHARIEIEKVLAPTRDLLRLAEAAPKIADAMSKADNYLRDDADIGLFAEAVNDWDKVFSLSDADKSRFEPVRRWYDERVEEVYNTLRNKITATIGETQTELNPENLPRYVKLLLLNPNDDLGQSMLRQLGVSSETLRRRFTDLINSLPRGQGKTGSGDDILKAQIDELREQQIFYRLVIDIAQRFPASLRNLAGQVADSLADDSRMHNDLITDVIKLMSQLQQKANEFRFQLRAFGLDETNINSYEQIIRGYHKTLEEAAGSISRDITSLMRLHSELGVRTEELEEMYRTHPVMQSASANRDTLIGDLNAIAEMLKSAHDLAEHEQFAEAQSIIETTNNFDARRREVFARSPIRETFTVHDPYPKMDLRTTDTNSTNVRGWDNVGRWVRTGRGMLERILQWSAPFYTESDDTPSVVGWDNHNNPAVRDTENDIADKNYYDYLRELIGKEDFSQAIKQQITALISAGDFEDARTLLHRATSKDGILPSGLLSLENARDQVSLFPVAEQENTFTKDFDLAKQCAGSIRGRERLQWVYDHRLTVYKIQLEDADRLSKSINAKEKRWDDLHNEYVNKLSPISKLVMEAAKTNMFGRKAGLNNTQKDELNKAYDAILKHINQIREEFPHDPDLWRMEKQKVMLDARLLLGF